MRAILGQDCSHNYGGVGGIRTLEPVKATRFPVVLVMTTSILLQVVLTGVIATAKCIIPVFRRESSPFFKDLKILLPEAFL